MFFITFLSHCSFSENSGRLLYRIAKPIRITENFKIHIPFSLLCYYSVQLLLFIAKVLEKK